MAQLAGQAVRARRASLYLPLAAALALAAAVWTPAFVGRALRGAGGRASRLEEAPRPSVVARRVDPQWSRDRAAMARYRQEQRIVKRVNGTQSPNAPINTDLLPSVEDIFSRRFSGNATIDPIGGRKRYTFLILVKDDPRLLTTGQGLKKKIKQYMRYMKDKMSCRDIKAKLLKSPLDNVDKKDQKTQVYLEYPMKEYGEVPRGMVTKPDYNRGLLVEITAVVPVQAVEYIQKQFYKDNAILRHMCLGHTRSFKMAGEDNELLL